MLHMKNRKTNNVYIQRRLKKIYLIGHNRYVPFTVTVHHFGYN